jgi:hypothetical protein
LFFVTVQRFYHAALAFENCNSKYKAVFAEPKPSRNSESSDNFSTGRGQGSFGMPEPSGSSRRMSNDFMSNSGGNVQETTLNVMCSPTVKYFSFSLPFSFGNSIYNYFHR